MRVQYKGKTRKVKKLKDGGFHLDLSRKKITSISQIKGLENLSDLTVLDLSYNKISEIKGLDNLKNLTHLYLMDNLISELKGLEDLVNLKYIDVSRNPFDDWMKQKFGRGPYGQGVVEYCRKMVEGEDYDYSRVEGLLDQAKKEIETIIKTIPPRLGKKALMESYDTIGLLLKEIFKKAHDPTIFYDFLGNLLSQNLNFFDSRFSSVYNSIVADKILQKLEMESYILEKYCFFEGESFISNFYGAITHGNFKLEGRIFATNYRIIGHGAYSRQRGDISDVLFSGNIPNLARFTYSTSKSIFEDIKQSLNYKDLPIFGYHYPLLKAKNASLTKKALKFKSDHLYKIDITTLNDESKVGWIERTQANLIPIYNYLIENQMWKSNR